jgi:hypothetical protein
VDGNDELTTGASLIEMSEFPQVGQTVAESTS